MYKFEISADTAQELEEKMSQFAKSYSSPEQYVDEVEEDHPVLPNFNELVQPQNPPPIVVPQYHSEEKVVAGFVGPTEVDTKGLPWDGRIHLATKKKNKDGTWTNRRGLDENTRFQVEQELRQGLAQAPSQVAPAQPIVSALVETQPEPVVEQQAPPVQQQTDYDNFPKIEGSIKPAHTLQSFKDNLTEVFAQLINQGKIDQNYIQQVKSYFKVKEVWNILANEKSCIELYEQFAVMGFITKLD